MGPYERGCGVMSAEQRGPSVCNVSFNREGKDEMTKASIDLQDLRRRLYVKAKAETSWRFWGLYVHVCKLETLRAAYVLAQKNDGAPGVDGVTFAAIKAQGVEAFLVQIRDELVRRTYAPLPARRQEIPKDGGKVRVLSIPAIRDRVVQVRSSSYWSRSSRPTSNRARLDIVPSGQLMKRSTGWRRQLFSTRHAS
jgi:retron-type reverse transcriptase